MSIDHCSLTYGLPAMGVNGKEGNEAYSSLCYKHRTATGTHIPYGITQLSATRQRWHSCLYPSQLRLVLVIEITRHTACPIKFIYGYITSLLLTCVQITKN